MKKIIVIAAVIAAFGFIACSNSNSVDETFFDTTDTIEVVDTVCDSLN